MGFFEIAKNLGLLEVVDNENKVIGFSNKDYIDKKGLRHRSIGIIITNEQIDKNHKLLISYSQGEFNLPIKDHLKIGQSYIESAHENIKKLFSESLENKFVEIAKYKNDYKNDLENFCLFHLIYDGIIENTKNISFFWINKSDLIKDFLKYPNYSHSLKNAFRYLYQK
mgnify:FL=1